MADETNEQLSTEVEQESQKKNALPNEVTNGEGITQRSEHFEREKKAQDLIKRFGETSYMSFMNKIGSDGVFAQRVVEDLLSGDEKKQVAAIPPDAPQENNITGQMDHTGNTPTKLTRDGQAKNPPVILVGKVDASAKQDDYQSVDKEKDAA